MRVLSLVSPEKSDIKYSVIKFTDTQILLNLSEEYQRFGFTLDEKEPIQISSRMSWNDLQYIISAVVALRNHGVKKIHLFIPFFLGARSDRSFQKMGINYLKQVICPILNSLHLESIITMDPHSHCLEMGLNNFKVISNEKLVTFALNHYVNSTKKDHSKLVWLIPDKGAVDKAYETIKSKDVQFLGPVVECTKKRDIATGKITSTEIPSEVLFEGDDCLIVDDIADGSWTFIKLAEAAKKKGAGNISLCVTHGIFSKGFPTEVDQIYTTNSFQEFSQEFERVHVLNVF